MKNGQTVSWIINCAFIVSCVIICMESPAIDAYEFNCLMPDDRLLPCADACCMQHFRGCCWCFSPYANLSSLIGPCLGKQPAGANAFQQGSSLSQWTIGLIVVLAVCLLIAVVLLILGGLKWSNRRNNTINDVASGSGLSSRAHSTLENQ